MDQTIKAEDNDNKDEDNNNNNANTDGDNGSNNPTINNKPQERHQRKRKKRLLTAIRQQIEFYFSDANLRHDRFMRQLIGAEDPEHSCGQKPVDLAEFLKFNRISELTTNTRDIGLALDRSVGLKLDANRQSVRRSRPFTAGSVNTDDQTLYVERLPPTADQQWLWSVFGTFGKIQYVKIPRFKNNNQIMGFAFVEFEDKLSAEKALKHFTAEPNPQESDDNNKCDNKDAKEEVVEEDTKVSEQQQTDSKVVKTTSKVLGGKRPLPKTTTTTAAADDKDEDITIGEEVERKRTKLSDDDVNQKQISSEQSESNSMVIVNNNEMTMKKTSDGEIDTKLKTTTKKKKKKRKKKKSIAADFVVEDNNNNNNNNDNDNNHQNHHHQQHHHNNHNNTNKSSEVINLRVMSKHEWKSWKKRYLQLQKQTMSSLKKSLEVMDNNNERQQQQQQRQTTDGKTVGDTNNDIVVAVDRSYDKGLIIKLNFKVASQEFNENQFKRNVRQMADKREISYIDLQTNQLEFVDSQTIQGLCYIRTVSQDVCQRLVADERLRRLGGNGSEAAVVLDGSEESDYWMKIFDERSKLMAYQQKYNYNTNNNNNNNKNINNKKSRHNKIRGFDKIINRADNQLMTTNVDNNNTKKVNKHIKFD